MTSGPMNHPSDEHIDRMMAALYGELTPEEGIAFHRELEENPALREEYTRLSTTRTFLQDWDVPGATSGPALGIASSFPGDGAGRGSWRRIFRMPWSWAAAAAMLALVLAASGFRVQTIDGGIAFRMGDAPVEQLLPAAPIPAANVAATQEYAGSPLQLASLESELNRRWDDRETELMTSLVTLLNEYSSRRDNEMAELVQSWDVNTRGRQESDYRDLNRRIDALGFRLIQAVDSRPAGDDLSRHLQVSDPPRSQE